MKTFPKAILGLLKIGVLLLGVALVTPADATMFTLTDLNSSAQIHDASQSGMSSWTVNGVNQLAQQWFWYRTGSSGGQSSIDTLPLLAATASDTNGNGQLDTLFLSYGSTSGLQIDVRYTLRGTASSGSDMQEQINITNNSTSTLDLHFFQYTNFNLNGTPAGDTVSLINANTVRQSKSGALISETVATPAANHYELGLTTDSPNTLTRLNSGGPITLLDGATTRGPGDATWAFEWDRSLAPGATLQISKDKNLQIPEPGTLTLIAMGFVGLAFLRKRH
jgi:PEP-CTERM motif